MQAVARNEAEIHESQRKGGVGRRHDYIGTPGEIEDRPQAFLVVRPYANARIEPHFHDVDQFQIVVAGDGRIGKKAVRPITFQYADAFTPYGPIVARDDGISFFTLRNFASGGHWSMPGNKHNMPCRAGRNIEGVFELGNIPQAGTKTEELMPQQSDGVRVVGIRLAAHAEAPGIPAEGGQFYLVCSGTILQDGRDMPESSLIRVEAGEAAPSLLAGAEGAEVLVVQFANPSQRPGSDPAQLAHRAAGYVKRQKDGT